MTDVPTAPARVKDRPTWLVSRAYARSSAMLNDGFAAAGAGLRGYHYRLLAAIDEFGPTSQADLGRGTQMDRSDVTGTLAELESQGLVERAVDPADRRRNVVTITPDGRRRLDELDAVLAGIQDDFLAPLAPAERDDLVRLLRRLTASD